MRRSEYDKLIKYADDRYLGWIELSEEVHASLEDAGRAAAESELSGLGYVLMLKDGGRLEDDFLRLSLELCRDGKIDVVYCDEDTEIGGRRICPFFKPDFSPDTLRSFFYFGGAVLVRRELLEDGTGCGAFRIRMADGDCCRLRDAITAYQNANEINVYHIPQVLYHACSDWDYAYIDESGPDLSEGEGAVSAVILSKDNVKMLLEALDSLIGGASRPMEYIVVDNGSSENNRSVLTQELSSRGVKYIYHPQEFIYSALCNIGAKEAQGRFLLFLNDDIILPKEQRGFPDRLCAIAGRPGVGAVGVRLLYPPRSTKEPCIQHIGITQLNSGPSHKLCTYPDNTRYEKGRNRGIWNCMAVTGACLLVERDKFFEVGGFDESLYIAYTDVDLCMDLAEKGYLSVVDNDTWLYHYESVSRGLDGREEKRAERLKHERHIFYGKHPYVKEGDRFYSRNLTSYALDYSADCRMPWEERVVCKRIGGTGAEDAKLTLKLLPEGRIMGSIDAMSYEAAVFDGEQSCCLLEGWTILHGKDQLDCEPAVVLVGQDGTKKIYSTVRKYRKDLGAVFPKEKNTLMSGFVCRIPISDIPDGMTRLGVGAVRSGLFREELCYYMMTDKVIES